VDPHLIFYPQRVPETYSYTLSEGLIAGTPLLVPDFGVYRERTEGLAWCWRYNLATTPQEMAALIVRLRSQIAAREAPEPPLAGGGSFDHHTADAKAFYPNEYLTSARIGLAAS
jgi:hypothetical protein